MSLLRLSAVTKSYPRGPATIDVLRAASLTVAEGSLVSVYGAPGSGKTTLLRIAAGIEPPDAGQVLFQGHPTGDVAWVQSDGPHTPQLAIGDYVALARYRELGQRAAQRRARATLAALGVERHFGDRWEDLPDAVRMLCAIAQALAKRPRLMIVDDPTAGLGLLDRERVCGALRRAAEDDGLGVLIAVPDVPSMLRSHEAHVLSRGRLLTAEPPAPGADGAEVVDIASRRSA